MKKSKYKILKVLFFLLILIFQFFENGKVLAQSVKINLNSSLVNDFQKRNILKTTGSGLSTLALLFPLNPILLIENEKFYVGITKELSVGKFPYGRLAAEYSLIFRETHVNQLRFSYNFDIHLVSGDFAAVMFSAGGGYFTDFDKFGYFPQISAALLLPATENITADLYFKTRYTVMDDKSKSNIFDVSFGLSSAYYF